MNEPMITKCPQCGRELPSGKAGDICPRCAAALLQSTQTEVSGGREGHRAFTPPSVAQLAPMFPQLEIVELLGRGGMGAVYKARQKELDRIVALKILPPGIGDDLAFAERFAREAKALARLNNPGIVAIYDFGRADGLFYFLMEFVDGVSLRRLLESGRVSPREALAIVPQICDALQCAHDQGIVHRDIKPENILLDRRGRVKVADFGLAKLVGTRSEPVINAGSAASPTAMTDAGKIMGTPAYMAPEQTEHPADVDHRADIYALGVVFYQMLTGELPPKPLQPPSRKVQIDVRLDEVVLQALEKDPERRYQQASQVKTAVETISATSAKQGAKRGVAAGEQTGAGAAEQVQPRWWLVLLAGLLTGVLLAFGAMALLNPWPRRYVFALLAGGMALAIFLLARKTWMNVFLAGLVIACFSWLGIAGAVTGALPLAVAAVLLALSVLAFVVKKLHSRRGFLAGFVIVFLMVFGTSAVIAFILPESFASTARISITASAAGSSAQEPLPLGGRYDPYFIQTEFEVIQSEIILGKVIQDLDLNKEWGKKYANGEKLKTPETMNILKGRMDLRPVRGTSLIEIRVYSDRPDEAAMLANAIARVYQDHREQPMFKRPGLEVEIIDRAQPGLRPVRPNKPLNLAIGALAGMLFGTAGGAARIGFESWQKRRRETP